MEPLWWTTAATVLGAPGCQPCSTSGRQEALRRQAQRGREGGRLCFAAPPRQQDRSRRTSRV
eukprot:6912708-Alexandrium_andersonii.AAC.1